MVFISFGVDEGILTDGARRPTMQWLERDIAKFGDVHVIVFTVCCRVFVDRIFLCSPFLLFVIDSAINWPRKKTTTTYM